MPKDRFDGIKNMVIRNANDGLYTKVDNKKITLNNAKKKQKKTRHSQWKD